MELTIDQALEKGIKAHKAGKVQEANSLYTAVLKVKPKHPDANHNIGLLAVGIGKVEDALPFFKTALESNPGIAQFWLSYIDALIKLERLSDAETVFGKAKEKGAKGDGFDKLGQRLKVAKEALIKPIFDENELEKCHSNILDTFKLDQAIKLAKKKSKDGSLEEAKNIYLDILNKFPKNKKAIDGIQALSVSPMGRISSAQDPTQDKIQPIINLYSQGKYKEALDNASQLLQLFPDSVTLCNIKGAANAGLGFWDAAIESYTKVLAINPNNAEAHHNIGVTLQDQGKLDDAIESYGKAVSIKPDFVLAHYNLANCLKEQGKLGEAIEAYTKVLSIQPDSPDAYLNMGVALHQYGELEKAIEVYKKGLNIQPDNADAYYNNIGLIFIAQDKPKEATEAFKKALTIKPDYVVAYYNMGNSLRVQGKLEEAKEAYSKAISLKPDYAEAHNNLGIMFQEQGDAERAIKAYKNVLSLNPESAETYNNIGTALRDQGELEKAVEALNKAISIKPDFYEAKNNLISLLTTYKPPAKISNDLVDANRKINQINVVDCSSCVISDEIIIHVISQALDAISDCDRELKTPESQIYRKNAKDLNCDRHMSVFKKHEIIPEFCFGCYKVQVEPKSLIDLVKLFLIFNQIILGENNTRKCMIEVRPKIPGFYKGLIYCRELKEANHIAEYLKPILSAQLGSGVSCNVKRGCSEYGASFLEYPLINKISSQPMEYNEKWRIIEDKYDKLHEERKVINHRPSLFEINLNDILIIQKWIDYARGLGDPSYKLLQYDKINYQNYVDIAKERLDDFPFSPIISQK